MATTEANPVVVEEQVPENSLEKIKKIQEAVNNQLATCTSKIDGKDVVIKVTLEQKEVKTGGKRNKRKTLSKRSARKSHKSRRVFGGKRK